LSGAGDGAAGGIIITYGGDADQFDNFVRSGIHIDFLRAAHGDTLPSANASEAEEGEEAALRV
jgi:hypothetical protein